MEKVKKVWKRIRGLVAASGQLRVGLVLFALVLLVVLFAPQLAPFDPYDLGDDLLVPPGPAGHLLGTTNTHFNNRLWQPRPCTCTKP